MSSERKHNELLLREGMPFIIPLVIITLVAMLLSWFIWIQVIGLLLTAFTVNFFRNPYRKIPDDPMGIVSPADGKVVGIFDLEDGRKQISIFLNVFNVHVNRSPIEGRIEKIKYTEGKFLAADHKDASAENERNALTIKSDDMEMVVTQVAGLIARRIICWKKEGDPLKKGERFGMIRFGSRTDIILSASNQIEVREGQKVKGGRDLIARKA